MHLVAMDGTLGLREDKESAPRLVVDPIVITGATRHEQLLYSALQYTHPLYEDVVFKKPAVEQEVGEDKERERERERERKREKR